MFKSVAHERTGHPDLVVRSIFVGDSVPVTWEPETQESVNRPEFTRQPNEQVDSFPTSGPRVLVLGLGERSAWNDRVSRQVASTLAKKIAAIKVKNVHLALELPDSRRMHGQMWGEAFGLTGWDFRNYKGAGSDKLERVDLRVCSLEEEFDIGLAKGLSLSRSVNWTRDCVWTPPNVATPDWMAEQAESLGQMGLDVRVLRGQDLEKEGLVGLVNVGKASENKPCFIRIEYRPDATSTAQPVVLLGKTITYDTGGLAIKSRDGMKGMKVDKAGGCAVLGAMHAVATVIKPAFPVIGLLVAAENSINENAFRMDDVLKYRNGVTVEVTNTDAEGRLVLADGLCWACDQENPRCIIDLATLTGGVVVALGGVYAGLFSNDDTLAEAMELAGQDSGELVWRLPLHPEYTETMKSDIADLVNSAPTRGGHPIQGAAFLAEFVKKGVAWAHIDIAGTAKADRDKGAIVPGPTGFGVRLLARYLEALEPR